MDLRIIKSPSQGTLDLVKRRMGFPKESPFDNADYEIGRASCRERV